LAKSTGNSRVGIEIADEEVRMAVATPGDDGCVVRCRRRALPAGAVAWGRIEDPDAVVGALRALAAAEQTRPRQASLVVGGPQTVCRVEAVAGARVPEAMAACQDRMSRYVVFGGEPTLIACTLQGNQTGGDEPSWLLGAAALRQLAMRQVETAKRAGLTVVRAEPAMAAVGAALRPVDAPAPARFVLMAHADGYEIAVLRQDGLIFCRQHTVRAEELARDPDQLVATLEQVLDYHLRHAGGQEPIEELLCCGSLGGFDGLFDRLSDAGVRARWVDPLEFSGVNSLDGDGVGEPAERAAMAPTVAVALDGAGGLRRAGALDLLPPAEKKRHLRAPKWAIAPAVVTFIVAIGLLVADSLVRRQSDRLTYLLNHPTPQMLECARLQLQESQLKERRADVRAMMGSVPRHTIVELVTELPRRMPKEVWLDRVSIELGSACLIDGMAQTQDAMYAFAEVLGNSPYAETVRISRNESERMEGLFLTRFRVEAALAKLEAPPREDVKDD
jgi:Tfp pilus assembly protein PilN